MVLLRNFGVCIFVNIDEGDILTPKNISSLDGAVQKVCKYGRIRA